MVVTACRRRGGSLSRRSGSFRLGGTLKPNLKCESDLKPVLRHREMLSDPRSAIKAPQAQNDDRWRRPGQGRSPPAPGLRSPFQGEAVVANPPNRDSRLQRPWDRLGRLGCGLTPLSANTRSGGFPSSRFPAAAGRPSRRNSCPRVREGRRRLCGAAGFAVREKCTTVPSAWPSPVEAAGVGLAESGIRPRLGHAVVRLGAPAIQRFGTRRRAQLRLHRRAEGAVSLR